MRSVRYRILRLLGVLEWLDEIETGVRRYLAMEERRDAWQEMAESMADRLLIAERLGRVAEKRVAKAEVRANSADTERELALELAQRQVEALKLVLEPAGVGEQCKKIKCHSKKVAEQLARQVERNGGMTPMSMEAYTCELCGIQPVSGERWQHVRMVDRAFARDRKYTNHTMRTERMKFPLIKGDLARQLRAQLIEIETEVYASEKEESEDQ